MVGQSAESFKKGNNKDTTAKPNQKKADMKTQVHKPNMTKTMQ